LLNKENDSKVSKIRFDLIEYVILIVGLFLTYLASLYSYLLFHSIIEIISIVISGGIFLIGWHSRKYMNSSFFLVLGVSFLFISVIDLVHTLAYSGMGVFLEFDADLPTQLWIVARYWQALSYLFASIIIKKKIKANYLFIGYFIIIVILLTIIFQGFFPVCYIEGSGLTPFKIISEYVIDTILFVTLIVLYKNKDEFAEKIFLLIVISIISTMISELAFTFYISVFGFSNFIGHIFKVIAFFFVYKAVIELGIETPFDLLFRKMKLSDELLRRKAEDLEQTYSEFNQIFSASLPMRIISEDYEIIRVNKTYTNLFSLSKEKIIGKKCFDPDLKHLGHQCDTDRCSMKQIGKGNDYSEYELNSKLDDNTKIINLVRSVPHRNAKGEFVGIIQNFTNITERSKLEVAIKQSEKKYRTLVEDSLDGIWVIDNSANITFVNQSMADMFGYKLDEMIGKNLYKFMDEERKEIAEINFERHKQGIQEDHEFEFIHKSGKKVFTTLRASPIFDENGNFNGAMAFVTDITEQKIAREKITDMARFPLENPNPILRLSKKYVLLANNSSQNLFGIGEGSRIPEVLIIPVNEAFSKNKHIEIELPIKDRIYNLFIVPIKDAGYANIYGMDITEQKRAQEKIVDMAKFPFENPNPILRLSKKYVLLANNSSQNLFGIGEGSRIPEVLIESVNESFSLDKNIEMELKIEDRIYNLFIVPIKGKEYANIYGMDITARKEAEEALGRFVSMVSHELRTPVSVLIMSIEFLENHTDKITPDIEKKLREGISRNIYLLKDLIENILTLSRIDEGEAKLEWKEYQPSRILKDILTLMEPIGNQKNITYRVEVNEDIKLYGDSKKVDQIFRILIDNSMKYSNEKNNIEITVIDHYKGQYNSNAQDGVLFQFEDRGIGISEKDISSIFQRFFRSDQVSDIPGTGLGLPIAKELIELHNGEVYVESEYGKGTIFYVFFPRIEKDINTQ